MRNRAFCAERCAPLRCSSAALALGRDDRDDDDRRDIVGDETVEDLRNVGADGAMAAAAVNALGSEPR